MEIVKFLSALYRRRLLLIIIPLISVIITYFLVRYLPDTYLSKSDISTGITDNTQQVPGQPDIQESEINLEFNNMIQLILLKQTIDQLSYQLIIHDLTSDKPFRKPSKVLEKYTAAEKNAAVAAFTKMHEARTELLPTNKENAKLFNLVKSMRYDDNSIRGKITVYRVNTSDYITIESESENGDLSAFIANTLTEEFIATYAKILKGNRLKTSDWLYKLLMEKLAAMKAKMEGLKSYKIQNRVLNLEEHSKVIYGQIGDFETRRELTAKDIIAYTALVNSINNKFSDKDKKYLEAAETQVHDDILQTKTLLNNLNEAYVRSGFKQEYKTKIDSLREVIGGQIRTSSDKYIYNPMAAKADLVNEKLKAEVALELAKNSVQAISDELKRLDVKLNAMVPHEAFVKDYETAIDVASREYLEILEKWNEFNMSGESTVKLKQVQAAISGDAQPSKKMLLVILSGIISFVFCVAIIFVFYILDSSVDDAQQLADKTGAPVLASIDEMKSGNLDLKNIWHDTGSGVKTFKNQLRSLRFELEQVMTAGSKVLTITSIKASEGKTFMAINLAYAWSMANKKVLLIDGNFGNAFVSKMIRPDIMLEDFLAGKANLHTAPEDTVVIMGNKGGDSSLPELASREASIQRMDELKRLFDIIIIDAPALETMEKAKEWVPFSDSLLSVFEAGNPVNASTKQYIQYLSSQPQMVGWVLNKV